MADPKVDGISRIQLGKADFYGPGDARIQGWIQEAIQEGEQLNKDDPAYPKMDAAMEYVLGNQLPGTTPSYVPKIILNQTKKAIRTHVAALTDIRPLFQYKTFNLAFQEQQELLNKLIVTWWINTFADLELGEAIKYALTAGVGDILTEYDPKFGPFGDNRLVARDPRDTIPIRPTRDRSIQTWEGVIIRDANTVNKLKALYPERAGDFVPVSGKWGQIFTRFRKMIIPNTGGSTLDGLKNASTKKGLSSLAEVPTYRVYINDRSINLTGQRQMMGDPSTNWGYWVEPGAPLYPRKRLIVTCENLISPLYDGPNPYWHAGFPITRLKLDSWPWQFLGLGLVHDLMPVQDAINTFVNDHLSVLSQWVNRGLVADKNAVPESVYRRFDPRRPNWKMKVKATMGESVKLVDGPTLPAWTPEFGKLLFSKFDELSETANLQQLMQLRQMPGADTIEKYYESLTPGIRLEGRMLEAALRDVAEQLKCNIFQFYGQERRILVLGDTGQSLADFDYDPKNMIPAMDEGMKGYSKQLDKSQSRDSRAEHFMKLFTFYVQPNSILAMHAQEKQMMYLQLSRQGYIDVWTLAEMMEIPNFGPPPAIPLPVKDWVPTGTPGETPPMVVRVPTNITERLIAQQQIGIGQTASPAGRKASGQAPPSLVNRPDGSQTVTES